MISTEDRVRVCVDRPLPLELSEEALRVAIEENPENDPDFVPETPAGADPGGERIAIISKKRWRAGKILDVRFLDGSPTMQEKVKRYAAEWMKYANIKFRFGNSSYAQIRISFYADAGSWSALGTDALVTSWFPRHQPTMNFGWLRDDTNDEEYSRVVIHEFGHALGAIHEHQNPDGGIQWNKDAVYKYFSGPPNYWDRESIDSNILDKYAEDQLIGTKFDPDSIMLYAFPASLTLNNRGTKENTRLSPMDIAFVKTAYPGR